MTSFAGRRTVIKTFAIGFGAILAGGASATEPSAAASLVGAGARVLPGLMARLAKALSSSTQSTRLSFRPSPKSARARAEVCCCSLRRPTKRRSMMSSQCRRCRRNVTLCCPSCSVPVRKECVEMHIVRKLERPHSGGPLPFPGEA
jgi:hypothetical protein